MHELWITREWESASDEQIIAALFDAPEFIHPHDMGWIKCNKAHCIRQYQHLFYLGDVPEYVQKIRNQSKKK